jgi:hypothetical protein
MILHASGGNDVAGMITTNSANVIIETLLHIRRDQSLAMFSTKHDMTMHGCE